MSAGLEPPPLSDVGGNASPAQPAHTLSMKRPFLRALPLLLALVGSIPAADLAAYGPPQGTLIVIGGGSERGAGIIETFINRAGGPEAHYVIVPTAHGTTTADSQPKNYQEDEVLAVWRTRGLKHVRMLHTADPAVADSEDFVQPLRTAHALWFDGDQQQDLLASYANTRAAREFAQVLQRGGVIAGNAAGATALGAHLLRADLSASSRPPSAEPGPAGFGFMRGTVFDLQINTRNRWDDLCPLIHAHPALLGLGISETTAIVVHGDRFEVIGKWTVTVHDSTLIPRPNEKPFRVLSPGDVFNLQTRRIEKLGNGTLNAPPMTPVPSRAPTAATPVTPTPPPLEYGPAKGTLIIVGGGSTRGTGIMETFINRAGGRDAKIVVIPTAGGNRSADGQPIVYHEEKILAPWRNQLGLKHVRLLHTPDPSVANTEEFVRPLREATGVWFDGGRQWHLVDSYQGTLALREIHGVLARGGAVGGTSAGATIQGDYLVRGAIAGPEIVMAPEPEHQHGFAFLRHTAIDQHINTRDRWDDLIPVIKQYPEYLGIGLSEGTAIIVNGDRFEVMGKWKVTVHDGTAPRAPWEKPYRVLAAGDVFNLRTRRIEQVGHQPQPIPPVIGTR